jgi:hypothetical protein
MNQPSLRFSLRKLFIVTTLIATIIGAAANYPIVLLTSLCLVSPLLFVATMAYFANQAPIVVRLVQLAFFLAILLLAFLGLITIALGDEVAMHAGTGPTMLVATR